MTLIISSVAMGEQGGHVHVPTLPRPCWVVGFEVFCAQVEGRR